MRKSETAEWAARESAASAEHVGKGRRVVGGQGGAVGIAVTQIGQQHPRAIGALPPEFGWLVIQSTPQAGRFDAEAAQDLRNLPGMAERIGDVADHHFRTELAGGPVALQQVADVRFGSDQEHIRQDVPGTDQDAAFLDVLAQDGFLLRAHGQVIIQNDGLAIQHEVFEMGVLLEQVEQAIDQVDEFQAEGLERAVPLTVPVGVRNKMDVAHSHSDVSCDRISSQCGKSSMCPSPGQMVRWLFGMRAATALPIATGVSTSSVPCQTCTGTRISSSRKPQGSDKQARLQGKAARALAQSLGLAGIVELQHTGLVKHCGIGSGPVLGAALEQVGGVVMSLAV